MNYILRKRRESNQKNFFIYIVTCYLTTCEQLKLKNKKNSITSALKIILYENLGGHNFP